MGKRKRASRQKDDPGKIFDVAAICVAFVVDVVDVADVVDVVNVANVAAVASSPDFQKVDKKISRGENPVFSQKTKKSRNAAFWKIKINQATFKLFNLLKLTRYC